MMSGVGVWPVTSMKVTGHTPTPVSWCQVLVCDLWLPWKSQITHQHLFHDVRYWCVTCDFHESHRSHTNTCFMMSGIGVWSVTSMKVTGHTPTPVSWCQVLVCDLWLPWKSQVTHQHLFHDVRYWCVTCDFHESHRSHTNTCFMMSGIGVWSVTSMKVTDHTPIPDIMKKRH